MIERRLRLAIDVGGTFTDVMLADPVDGRLIGAKVSPPPGDRASGVLDGSAAALDRADALGGEGSDVGHGSTTGTNALIERTGARVGLLTTEGFRDVLEIGRVMRPMEGLYDINVDRPPPLVPRRLCLEARERMTAKGEVLVALDETSVVEAAEVFARENVEAVAVCFLFAHLDPRHEERAAKIIAQHLPGIPISLSNRICPEYREYERASTTVMNAYLAPIMDRYLDDLEVRLDHALGKAQLFVVQANGGTASVAAAKARAVTTVNSGPAGGVVAAAWYGRRHRRTRIVSVDMGGTSFDIGLIEGSFKSRDLRRSLGDGEPIGPAILSDRSAADHRIDPIATVDRCGEWFENDDSGALGADVTVGACIKTVTATGWREHRSLARAQGHFWREDGIGSPCQGEITFPIAQTLAGHVNGDHR